MLILHKNKDPKLKVEKCLIDLFLSIEETEKDHILR